MTPQTAPDPDLIRRLDRAAEDYRQWYSRSTVLDNEDHGRQRLVTLESFDLIRRIRPDIHCFDEIVVLFPNDTRKGIGHLAPDTLVVVHDGPLPRGKHYSTHLRPARPFLLIDYGSGDCHRKDYDEHFEQFEADVQAPYYLHHDTDGGTLTLYRLAGARYVPVVPNGRGLLEVPELELHTALIDGRVRFWFRGELVPLPVELAARLDAERAALAATERERDSLDQRLGELEAELAVLRGDVVRLRGGG